MFIFLLCGCESAFAQCHTMSPSGSGSASGADWNNTLNFGTFTSFVRGHTYFLRDGVYASKRFNVAQSGTSVITIKKAVAADHCTDTGWVLGTMGSGQASLPSVQFEDQGFWTLDGNGTGNTCGYSPTSVTPVTSGCGFLIDNSNISTFVTDSILVETTSSGATPFGNITIRYLEYKGGGHFNDIGEDGRATVGSPAPQNISSLTCSSNVVAVVLSTGLSHTPYVGQLIAISGATAFNTGANGAAISAVTDSSHFSYSLTCTNGSGSGGNATGPIANAEHGLNYAGQVSDLLFEHNYFHDSSNLLTQGSGTIGQPAYPNRVTFQYNLYTLNTSDSAVHGVCWGDQAVSNLTVAFNRFIDCEGTSYWGSQLGQITMVNWSIYGNVFMLQSGNPNHMTGTGNGAVAIYNTKTLNGLNVYNNTFINIQGSVSGVYVGPEVTLTTAGLIENNLWYNSSSANTTCNNCTRDYNSYLNTTSPTLNTHDVSNGSPPNPFVNWQNGDFHLASENSNWNAWLSLGSPYNTDPDGVTRTSDRGAYQFTSGGGGCSSPVISSVTLNPTSVVGGNTSTGTATISCAPSVDTVVLLSSSNTAVATVPFSVKVLANQTTANFTVTTVAVCTSTNVTITATLGGSTTASLTVTAGGGQCQGANVIGTAKVMGTAVVQ